MPAPELRISSKANPSLPIRPFFFSPVLLSFPPHQSQITPKHSITMAARNCTKALRPLARQLATPAVQRRTFVAAASAVRASVAVKAVAAPARQQVRGVKTMDFAGHKEEVHGESRSRPT